MGRAGAIILHGPGESLGPTGAAASDPGCPCHPDGETASVRCIEPRSRPPMRFRFSLAVLISVVRLAALVFAASAYDGRDGLEVVIVVTPCLAALGLLCTAVLGACLGRGTRRA